MPGGCRGEQRLGRDTADVHARPTQSAPLDQHHPPPGAGRGDADRHRGTTGADHRKVELVIGCHVHLLPLASSR